MIYPLSDDACIVDSCHGIYVPKVWAERYGDFAIKSAHVNESHVADVLNGPCSDSYWDSWHEILATYSYVCDDVEHYLYQNANGDLFECPDNYPKDEDEDPDDDDESWFNHPSMTAQERSPSLVGIC